MANDVIMSFSARDIPRLRSGEISMVVRRRAPAGTTKRIFVYASAPMSGLVGFVEVLSQGRIDRTTAVKNSQALGLNEVETGRYFGDRDSMGFMKISPMVDLSKFVDRDELFELLNIRPPQNFQRIGESIFRELLSADKI